MQCCALFDDVEIDLNERQEHHKRYSQRRGPLLNRDAFSCESVETYARANVALIACKERKLIERCLQNVSNVTTLSHGHMGREESLRQPRSIFQPCPSPYPNRPTLCPQGRMALTLEPGYCRDQYYYY